MLIPGSKNFFTRFSVVITGIATLFLLNMQFVMYMKKGHIDTLWLLLFIIMALIFRRLIRIVNGLHYEFDEYGIAIALPSKKKYLLAKENIASIEKIPTLKRRCMFGINYDFFSREISFTTSTTGIIRVIMTDGRKILLSPKYIPDLAWLKKKFGE